MKLIYAVFYEGASVILNGQTIYHEDDDKGFHQSFTAEEVANRLSRALNISVIQIALPDDAVPVDYDFDVIQQLALAAVASA